MKSLPLFFLTALCASAQVVIQDNAARQQNGAAALIGPRLIYHVSPDLPQRMVGRLLLEGQDKELLERFTRIARNKDADKGVEELHRWQDELLSSEVPDPKAALNINYALAGWYAHECDREPEFMAEAAARYLTAGSGDADERARQLSSLLRFCYNLHPYAISGLRAGLFNEDTQETPGLLMRDPEKNAVQLLMNKYSSVGNWVRYALHDDDYFLEDYRRKGLIGWQYQYGKELPAAVRRAMELMAERRRGRAVTEVDRKDIRDLAAGMDPQLQGFIPRCLLALDPTCKPWAALNDPAASLFLMPDTSAVTLPQWDDALFGTQTTVDEDLAALQQLLQQPKLGTLTAFALREAELALPKGYIRARMGVEGYDEFTTYITLTLLRDGIDIVSTPQGPRFSADDPALRAQSRALQLALHRCILKLALLERDGKTAELKTAAAQLAAALNRSNAWPLLINEYELRGISPAALYELMRGFRGTPTVQRALASTLLSDRMMRHLVAADAETGMAEPTFLALLDPARSEEEKQNLRACVYAAFAKSCGWLGLEQQPAAGGTAGGDPRMRELATAIRAQISPDRWLELVAIAPGYRTERFNLLCGDTIPMAARRALMEKFAAEGHYESAAFLAEMAIHRACIRMTPGIESGSHAAIAELRRKADDWHKLALEHPSDEYTGLPDSVKVPPSEYPSIRPGLYEWHFRQKDGKTLSFRAGILSLDLTTTGYEPESRPLKLRKENGQELTVRMGAVSEEDYENINKWYELNDFQLWSENAPAADDNEVKPLRARLLDRYFDIDRLRTLPEYRSSGRESLRYLLPNGHVERRSMRKMPAALVKELEERHIPMAQGDTELRTAPSWWVANAIAEQDAKTAMAVFIGRSGGEAEAVWNDYLQKHPEDITALNHSDAIVFCRQDESGRWDDEARAIAASAQVAPKAGLLVCSQGFLFDPYVCRFWVDPADAAAEALQKDFLQAIANRQEDEALKLLDRAPALATAEAPDKGWALGMATERGMIRLVRRMLELGAQPLSTGMGREENTERATALELAAAGGPELLRLMMDAAGLTAAQVATAKLNPYRGLVQARCDGVLKPEQAAEAIAWVHGMGFDINAKNAQGLSALQEAVNYQRVDLVRALMLAGADSSELVYQGMGGIPLGLAGFPFIKFGRDSVPRDLRVALIETGYDVNVASPQTAETMLTLAMTINDVDMVKLLLDHGADINDKRYDGYPLLAHVAKNIITAQDDENRSKEEVEDIISKQVSIMELLLEHGVNVNAELKTHATMLDLFRARVHDERPINLLIAHGAKSGVKSTKP